MKAVDERIASALAIAQALTVHREPQVRKAARRIVELLRSYAEEEEALNLL